MSSNPVQFGVDQRQFARTLSYLLALQLGGPRVVASELNKAAMRWQREIRRHSPVDVGLLRQSWDVALANAGQGSRLEAAVGTNVDYAVYIEFGTVEIAKGAVLAWQVGDPPILDWPAKRKDAIEETEFTLDDQGRRRNKSGQFVRNDKDGGNTTEFMPMMRGSWPIVEPAIVQGLRNRLAKLLKETKP